MQWLSQHKISLFLLVFLAVFFCIYSYFNLIVISPQDNLLSIGETNVKFSSPDETANYFWLKQLAQGKPLYYFEELNGVATNLIHLRSLNTVNGKVTPGSFIGMLVIYGSLAKILGLWIVPFLTPFFSILGLLFFYLLIKKIFKHQSIALISTILLSFFPAWFYYSARGMYHNILFISLLLIGLYLLISVLESFDEEYFLNFLKIKKLNVDLKFVIYNLKLLLYFLSGLFIGLSIITRTSEIIWLAFTVLLIFIFYFKKINWLGFILFLIGLWIPALILLYYNQISYGVFISAGYRSVIPNGDIIQAATSGLLFNLFITPFGFNLPAILLNTYNYLYALLPFWSLPTIIGGFLFIILPKHIINISYKKRFFYLIYSIFIIIYLLVFYGSWQFSDRIDNQFLSLGTSYLRYWLPIYILAIPFTATLIWFLSFLFIPNIRWKKIYQNIIILILIIIIFIPSINLVIRQTDESLFLLKNLSEYRLKSNLINQFLTADDVIVIYKQADKIFFPQRPHIITALVVPQDYQAITRLVKIRPVYFYTYASPDIVSSISKQQFEPYNLKIIQGNKIFGHDWLYKIENE